MKEVILPSHNKSLKRPELHKSDGTEVCSSMEKRSKPDILRVYFSFVEQ